MLLVVPGVENIDQSTTESNEDRVDEQVPIINLELFSSSSLSTIKTDKISQSLEA